MDEEYLHYLDEMDTTTLQVLMQKYGQDVWHYAFFVTKNRSLADDITQDVFIRAYRQIATFRGESSFKTWLLRITRNTSYNYLKSAFFRRVLLVGNVKSSSYDVSAEQRFLEQEVTNEVWQHVYRLPTKLREVLVLHAKYELTMQEMAHILTIPEGTVKSRLFAARKRLSSQLRKEELLNESI